jgi:hypothetical protein
VLHRAVFSQDQYNAFFTDRPPDLTATLRWTMVQRYVALRGTILLKGLLH